MRHLLASVVSVLVIGSAARADIILSFTPTGAAASFSAAPGATVNIPVYLVERPSTPSTAGATSVTGTMPNGILAAQGLTTMGIRLNFPTNSGASGTVPYLSGIVKGDGSGTDFSGSNGATNTPTNGAGLTAANAAGTAVTSGLSDDPFTPVPAQPTGSGEYYIQFGTFKFTVPATATPGASITIGTGKPNGQLGNNPNYAEIQTGGTSPQAADGVTLDFQNYSDIYFAGGVVNSPLSYTTTLTVNPVPEPGLVLGVAAAGLWAGRRLRRAG